MTRWPVSHTWHTCWFDSGSDQVEEDVECEPRRQHQIGRMCRRCRAEELREQNEGAGADYGRYEDHEHDEDAALHVPDDGRPRRTPAPAGAYLNCSFCASHQHAARMHNRRWLQTVFTNSNQCRTSCCGRYWPGLQCASTLRTTHTAGFISSGGLSGKRRAPPGLSHVWHDATHAVRRGGREVPRTREPASRPRQARRPACGRPSKAQHRRKDRVPPQAGPSRLNKVVSRPCSS